MELDYCFMYMVKTAIDTTKPVCAQIHLALANPTGLLKIHHISYGKVPVALQKWQVQ